MKLNPEVIARAALRLLNEVGLDGLTMRLVANDLNVRAPTLYWHVKNKQELLDAMATLMLVEIVEPIEAPRRGVDWSQWLRHLAERLRRHLLRYRDGARVMAGTAVTHPAVYRFVELTLQTLQDNGFSPVSAARGFPTLYHYTVGFVIEEQSRDAAEYEENPYQPETMAMTLDPQRFPLTAAVLPTMFAAGADAEFDHGLGLILAGMRAELAETAAADLPSTVCK